MPRRGESWFLESGTWAVRLNEPLALRSLGLRTGCVRVVQALPAHARGDREVGPHVPLVLQEGGGLLLAEFRPARLVGGQAVEAAELPVLRPAAGEEVGLVGEDVDAAPVALEDLVDAGVVVVDARP